MNTPITTTEKLKRILKWLDFQNRLQTTEKIDMLYTFLVKNDIEFLDDEYLMSDNSCEEEYKKAKEFINKVYKMNE